MKLKKPLQCHFLFLTQSADNIFTPSMPADKLKGNVVTALNTV